MVQFTGYCGYEPEHFNPRTNCRIPAAYTVEVWNDTADERETTIRANNGTEASELARLHYPGITIHQSAIG